MFENIIMIDLDKNILYLVNKKKKTENYYVSPLFS